MIVEVNVEFLDEYCNDYTETLEIYIDDNESELNVETIIEDKINEWFISTGEDIFSAMVPKDSMSTEEWEYDFEKYLDNTELFSDLF